MIPPSQSNHSGMEIQNPEEKEQEEKESQSNHSGMEIGAGNGSPKPEAGSLGLVERQGNEKFPFKIVLI